MILSVYIASPFAARSERLQDAHAAYACECMAESLRRREAPIVPHLLYPAVLRDSVPGERELARRAGEAWLRAADLVAVYVDSDISPGMAAEMAVAAQAGVRVELRTLGSAEPLGAGRWLVWIGHPPPLDSQPVVAWWVPGRASWYVDRRRIDPAHVWRAVRDA